MEIQCRCHKEEDENSDEYDQRSIDRLFFFVISVSIFRLDLVVISV